MKNNPQPAHTYRRLIKKYSFQIILLQSRTEPETFYSYGYGSNILYKDFELGQPYGQNLFLRLDINYSVDKFEEYFITKNYSYAIFEYIEEDNKPFHKITRTSNQLCLHLTSIKLEEEFSGKRFYKNEVYSRSKNSKSEQDKSFLSAILKGIDPTTGEILSQSSAWLHPQIIADIKDYQKQEKELHAYEYNNKEYLGFSEYMDTLHNSPDRFNAYKKWTVEEDEIILLSNNKSIKDLSDQLHRMPGAIRSRRKKLSTEGKKYNEIKEELLHPSIDAVCLVCGENFNPDRANIGYKTCLACGEEVAHNNAPKLDEGLPGTREENKRMRAQVWGEIRKRSKGN